MSKQGNRDWLEPPVWWKKWKPLRWVAGVLLLAGIGSWIKALLPADAGPSPPEASVAAAPVEPPAAEPVTTVEPPPASPAASEPAPATIEPAPAAPAETGPAPPPSVVTPPPAARVDDDTPPEVAAYRAIAPDRSALLDPFRSYDSIEMVSQILTQKGKTPESRPAHRKVPDDVPPYELDTLTVREYEHIGVGGTLTLSFFNDRLFETEFQPDDPDAYLDALRRQMPQLKRGGTGRSEFTEGHLRVASSLELATSDVGRALRTRPYVLWQDLRLVQQRDEWDYKYAQKAVR